MSEMDGGPLSEPLNSESCFFVPFSHCASDEFISVIHMFDVMASTCIQRIIIKFECKMEKHLYLH